MGFFCSVVVNNNKISLTKQLAIFLSKRIKKNE